MHGHHNTSLLHEPSVIEVYIYLHEHPHSMLCGCNPVSLRNQQMEVVVLIGQLVVDWDTCLFIHDKCVCR